MGKDIAKYMIGYYNGCVKCGNLGDEILFPIFINSMKSYFERKFKKTIRIKKFNVEYNKDWKMNSSIGIVGGGSLIHAEEISYINGWEEKKPEFLNGTGLTDAPSLSLSLCQLEKINSGYIDDINFPINEMLQKNINVISEINYGGIRSPLDNLILNHKNPSIYDPGLLFSSSFGIKSSFLSNNKMVAINLTTVQSKNIFAPRILETTEVNNTVYNEITKLIKYLINNGFSVVCVPCTTGDNDIFNNIKQELETPSHKHIKIFENIPTNEEIAYIYKNAYFSIGTRLHSNIISASFSTPFISLSYGYKNISFCYSVDMLDYSIPYYKTNFQLLCDTICHLEKNHSKIKARLKLHTHQAKKMHEMELARYLDSIKIEEFDIIQWSNDFYPTFGIFKLT